MGAEAIRELLRSLDLDTLARELRASRCVRDSGRASGRRYAKRLKVVEAFRESRQQARVDDPRRASRCIPPDLRPLVPLDGGRFATSDLNDLYRRVINRNNRLKRLHGAERAGGHHPQREADAAGGGGRAVRQRPARPADHRARTTVRSSR